MATQAIDTGYYAMRHELAGSRVLVVDDSPSVLAFAASTLQRAGCEVLTSADIWIASTIAEFHPDIVLIDVNLSGGCTGPTVVRALKKRSLSRSVRYVLYSTASRAELDDLAASCDADGCLHKDGDPVALVREIVRVLDTAS